MNRILCLVLCFAPLSAEIAIPPGGSELTAASPLKAHADPSHGISRQIEGGGWKLEISRPDEAKPYLAQISIDLPESALAPGDTVLALFKSKSATGSGAVMEAKLQLAGAPYTMLAASATLELTPEWQELPVTFRVTAAAAKGTASVTLLCARQLQSIEVASIRAFKYPAGTNITAFPRIRRSYAGRDVDAPWRKAALDRIEQHRKADLSVRVQGPDGQPLADTEVSLTLRRHEFGFGSAVRAELFSADTEDGRRYREIVDRLFSQVVFENDLKDFGWEQGAEGKEEKLGRLADAFDWLSQRHISVRGHYLMQVAVPPNLAEITDPEAIRRHFVETAQKRLAFVQSRVCEWDVINHPVAWGGADLLSKRPGLEKLDREIYSLAQRSTSLPLLINEDQLFRPGRQSDETFDYVRQLKSEGFRVDGVGNQAHIDDSFLPTPERLLAVTDRFATLVPRQVITEFDVVTAADEELAADYTRDALIACFSHPAYTGFLLWGYWEGNHWKPEAASWNKDWTIRKRGEVLEEWIGRRWKTTLTLTTGKDGLVRWRGFPGWYDIQVNEQNDKDSFVVTKNTPSTTVDILKK